MNDDSVKQALEHLARQGMLQVNKDGIVQLRQPKNYIWNPQDDITAYELARALEVMFASVLQGGSVDAAFDGLPGEAQRHFQVVEK
ncbi:hypothetical protein [Sinorhizobium fredii]|uniref:hypothetical protein n=1 Tax=Rhizobium fredii TaxID=380 RepID=UPI0004B53832|nr:hypothetical protein [Sinorhizobium fredii]